MSKPTYRHRDWSEKLTHNPEVWSHRSTSRPRGPGIPAPHIDDVPNRVNKTEFWSRKEGAEALSLFHDPEADEYYVHHVVPSNDWTHGPFDEATARSKLDDIKQNSRED